MVDLEKGLIMPNGTMKVHLQEYDPKLGSHKAIAVFVPPLTSAQITALENINHRLIKEGRVMSGFTPTKGGQKTIDYYGTLENRTDAIEDLRTYLKAVSVRLGYTLQF